MVGCNAVNTTTCSCNSPNPYAQPTTGLTATHVRAKLGQLLNKDLGGHDMHPIVSHAHALLEDVHAIAGEEQLGPKFEVIVGLLFDTHKGTLEELARYQWE